MKYRNALWNISSKIHYSYYNVSLWFTNIPWSTHHPPPLSLKDFNKQGAPQMCWYPTCSPLTNGLDMCSCWCHSEYGSSPDCRSTLCWAVRAAVYSGFNQQDVSYCDKHLACSNAVDSRSRLWRISSAALWNCSIDLAVTSARLRIASVWISCKSDRGMHLNSKTQARGSHCDAIGVLYPSLHWQGKHMLSLNSTPLIKGSFY